MEILKKHPRKKSRPVTDADVPYLLSIRNEWHQLCHQPIGLKTGAVAIAHVQVEKKDPMTTFMLKNGDIIINPVITSSHRDEVRVEGCMSWPDEADVPVTRKKEIVVEHQIIKADSDKPRFRRSTYKNLKAAIFQHEIGHFNLETLY